MKIINTLSERIRAVRKTLNKKTNQTAFGEMLGLTRDQIKTYELGTVEAPEPTIRLICSTYGVDYRWLKTGEGEMYATHEAEIIASLDDLMTGEHAVTKALLSSLAQLNESELAVIDKLIANMLEQLKNNTRKI